MIRWIHPVDEYGYKIDSSKCKFTKKDIKTIRSEEFKRAVDVSMLICGMCADANSDDERREIENRYGLSEEEARQIILAQIIYECKVENGEIKDEDC